MGDLFKALREVARTFRVGSESTERTERLIILIVVTSVTVLTVFSGVCWIVQNIWY